MKSILEALRTLLLNRAANTQEALCIALEKEGFSVNQSTISRLVRKLGATKVKNEHGQIVYSLPLEPGPPSPISPLHNLIIDIVANECLVVIFTSPGSASVIARVLDYNRYNRKNTEILGTIAGDDTIFVTPKSTKNIHHLLNEVKTLLAEIH